MDPILAELLRMGVGWAVAAYFYRELVAERADRRKCDDATRDMMLGLKDESHTRVIEANTRQDQTFSKLADAIGVQSAQLQELRGEVKAIRCKGAVP